MTSAYEDELAQRIDELRTRLDAARREGDEHTVDMLLVELDTLVGLADRSDLDTHEMEAVLAAETGALPIIPDPEG